MSAVQVSQLLLRKLRQILPYIRLKNCGILTIEGEIRLYRLPSVHKAKPVGRPLLLHPFISHSTAPHSPPLSLLRAHLDLQPARRLLPLPKRPCPWVLRLMQPPPHATAQKQKKRYNLVTARKHHSRIITHHKRIVKNPRKPSATGAEQRAALWQGGHYSVHHAFPSRQHRPLAAGSVQRVAGRRTVCGDVRE